MITNHRPEPRSMTTADLAALVVGVALAVSLEFDIARFPCDWYVIVVNVPKWIQWLCITLAPAVLVRRARYGGPIRPAEFAALAVALPLLLSPPLRAVVQFMALVDGRGDLSIVEAYGRWERADLVLSASSALLVVAGRRRLWPWVNGLLALGGWYGLTHPAKSFAGQLVDPIRIHWVGSIEAKRLLEMVLEIPLHAMQYVPTVAALVALRHRGRRGLTWLEWVGVGLAACWWLATRVRLGARAWLDESLITFEVWLSFQLATQAASLGLADALALRFGPALGRWLDPRGDE